MDLSWYAGKKVFVTGHTGFKGSWLCRMLVKAGAVVTGYALPPQGETHLFGLLGLEKQLTHVVGDVRDAGSLWAAYSTAAPEVVFHLAAQPLVGQGYADPTGTYATNVMGVVNLLECVRRAGTPCSVVNVTTDKVYHNNEWVWGYREEDVLDGYDPYSNSKSCSELVSATFSRCFLQPMGVQLSCARAGNVIGGGDFADNRIVPDCFRAAQAGKPVEVRNPASTRPYQHVLEPVTAYLLLAMLQAQRPELASVYNIGPDADGCASTKRLLELFCNAWGCGQGWRDTLQQQDAPHEAKLLVLDCAKAKKALGWRPRWSLKTAVEHTARWYKALVSGEDVAALTDEQITLYLAAEEQLDDR